MSDQIRNWYPHYSQYLQHVHAFWQGKGGRFLISVDSTQHPYRQQDDEQVMLDQARNYLRHIGELPGFNLPYFAADFGTVSTAKYWGGTPRRDSTGGNIFMDPVAQTLDEALPLSPAPIDAPDQHAARAIRLFRQLCNELGTDALWLRTPDMQGPLNTAGMVMNQEELMMAMYTDPDQVHLFLKNVTDHLIAYQQWLRREANGKICGNIWPYTFLPPEFGFSLTEDLMPLMSTKSYAEFGIPCLRRLTEALGPAHIHCCGEWGRHVPTLIDSGIPICAVEFHYPFTTIDEVLPLARNGAVLIPMIVLEKQEEFPDAIAYFKHLLAHTGPEIRYWFALFEELEGALGFARQHSPSGIK